MREQDPAISNDDLHAYVDGALDPLARARVEAHLQQHSEDAERVGAYQRQNEALRSLADTLDRTPGGRAIHLPRRALRSRLVHALSWAAAVAALLVLGGGSGWWAHGALDRASSKPELYQLAAGAYRLYTVQQKHPVEVWANERDHLQKWLANSLGAPFVAPELAQQGYELVGGRLLSNVSGPAALLLYEGTDKQRIVLYVAQTSAWGEGKAAFEAVGDLRTFTWKNGPLWFSLAGNNLNPDVLKTMAQSVNKQELADQGPAPTTVARRY